MIKIVLASSSPRRNELLQNIGLTFEVIPSNVEESTFVETSPYERVKELSSKKALAVADQVQGPAVIIGADTIITDLGRILNKPSNREHAINMISQLQGKRHTVYTGMTLLFIDESNHVIEENYVDATDVTMVKMSAEEIEAYVNTNEYTDKAGGYAIQGKASVFIEMIYGNYNTVVGLPIHILFEALKNHGISITDCWK